MKERHVCTRRYALQLNSVPNTETTLNHRLGGNGNSNNREPENRNCSVVKVKVKANFAPEQATKDQRGSRGTALFFL